MEYDHEENGIGYLLDGYEVKAYDIETEEQIGWLRLTQYLDAEDDNVGIESAFWLDQVHVENDYQGKGIGKKLVELATHEMEEFNVAAVTASGAYKFSLTAAGERLIAACVREGIIQPSQLRFDNGVHDPGHNAGSLAIYMRSDNSDEFFNNYSDEDEQEINSPSLK